MAGIARPARLAVAATCLAGLGGSSTLNRPAPPTATIVLPSPIAASMNRLFLEHNAHWNELGDLNTLERMLGTVRARPREYLGCVQGAARGDTVRITGLSPAARLRQLPTGVSGSCEDVPRLLGTWHTHPYHADLQGRPLKDRRLSQQDLATFAAGSDLLVLAVWDVDSLDAALRRPDARISHPVAVVMR